MLETNPIVIPELAPSLAANHSPVSTAAKPASAKNIRQLAQAVGDDWKSRPYYDEAEQSMDQQWRQTIWPFIHEADFSRVVDLAAGHGRNSEKLKQHARNIHIVDINQENIDFCRQRFAGDPKFTFTRNDGYSLSFLPTGSVSLLYCFDAMVHFDSDVVRSYLKEFKRILQPGGFGFCHHSNYTANPGGDVHDNPGWRNFMSQSLFAHYCKKEGLIVVRSRVINWEHPGSDCLTLFRQEGEAPKIVPNESSTAESAGSKKTAPANSPEMFNSLDPNRSSKVSAPGTIELAPIKRNS